MTIASDTIQTERLLLRPLRRTDADALFTQFGNWEVICRLSSPPWPYAMTDAVSFIDSQLDQPAADNSYKAITLDGALIGGIDVRGRRPSEAPGRSPILGYWLGQPYWGRGYMTEAARGFIGHVFASFAVDTIYSGALADNVSSLRVQEKLGFERDGETMLYFRPRGGSCAHVNTRLAKRHFVASGAK